MRSTVLILVLVLCVSVISGCVGGKMLCPPAGFPQPPGCEGGKSVGGPGAREEFGCFPPTCKLIPDERGQVVCERFRSGQEVGNWPDDCSVMPLSCPKLCEAEKKRYQDVGVANWEAGIKNNADWWREPQTKVFVFGSVNQNYEQLQPDARAWGADPRPGASTNLEADMNHYWGMSWVAYGSCSQEYIFPDAGPGILPRNIDEVPQAYKSAVRRDLDGGLVSAKLGFGVSEKVKAYQWITYNCFVPEYEEGIIQGYKKLIDSGADGIILDDVSVVVSDPSNLATYFDEYTMNEFGAYLGKTLTSGDWAAAGFAGPQADFDYASFLRSKGYTAASFSKSDWKTIPFINDFARFLTEQNRVSKQKIVEEVRAYAESRGRTVSVTANRADLYGTAPLEQYIDYTSREFGFLTAGDKPGYQSVVASLKLAAVNGKSSVNVMSAGIYDVLAKLWKQDPETYYDVYRLAVMESYAARSSHVYLRAHIVHPVDFESEAAFLRRVYDSADMREINTSYSFMRRYKEYFADFKETNAKVAVVYDSAAMPRMMLDSYSTEHFWQGSAVADGLYRSGFDVDVVRPDAAFSKYTLIVLPELDALPDAQAGALLEWVQDGGTLLLGNKPVGKLADVEEGTLGKGRVRIVSGSRERLADAALEEAQGKAAPIATSAGLAAVSYHNSDGEQVVHLFALKEGAGREGIGFAKQTDISVTLPFKQPGQKVFYASLENPELVELDSENIVIPEIRTYGMIVVKK